MYASEPGMVDSGAISTRNASRGSRPRRVRACRLFRARRLPNAMFAPRPPKQYHHDLRSKGRKSRRFFAGIQYSRLFDDLICHCCWCFGFFRPVKCTKNCEKRCNERTPTKTALKMKEKRERPRRRQNAARWLVVRSWWRLLRRLPLAYSDGSCASVSKRIVYAHALFVCQPASTTATTRTSRNSFTSWNFLFELHACWWSSLRCWLERHGHLMHKSFASSALLPPFAPFCPVCAAIYYIIFPKNLI